jgi:hypothetical protein
MTPAGSAMLIRYPARTTQLLLYRGGMRDGTTFFVVQDRGRYTGWDTAVLGDELLPLQREREMLDDGMITYTSLACAPSSHKGGMLDGAKHESALCYLITSSYHGEFCGSGGCR